MPRYDVTICRLPAEKTLRVIADSPALAVQGLLETNRRFRVDWEIMEVDGLEVIARCEGCGVHIFEGDGYVADDDGIYLCRRCTDQEPTDAQ